DTGALRPREAPVEADAAGSATRDGHELALRADAIERGRVRAEHVNDGVRDALAHLVEIEAERETTRGLRERGCFTPLALALRVEPRVLERERGLVGEGLQRLDLLRRELASELRAHDERPDGALRTHERHADRHAMTEALDLRAQSGRKMNVGIVQQVVPP